MFKYGLTAAFTYLVTATSTLAQGRPSGNPGRGNPGGGNPWGGNPGGGHPGGGSPGNPVAVPEIDASSGLLAIAAVGALLLLVWERSRSKRGTRTD